MVEARGTGEPPKHRRLELLDILRFVAALMVVVFHWYFNGIDNGKVKSLDFGVFTPVAIYGVYGVHLFFMISGFVIVDSARGKTAGQFVVSRGVRLFPAYWIAMIATTFVVNIWGINELKVNLLQFLANGTMIPQILGQSAIDGVYWTLTIELTFYLLVGLILLLGLGRFLDVVFPVWAMLMLLCIVVLPEYSGLPYLGGYYTFFATGAIISTLRRRGFTPLSVAGLIASVVGSFIFVSRGVSAFNQSHGYQADPVVVFGILAVFHCALMWLIVPSVGRMTIPFSRAVSDLTYPVYLLHAHIGYTVLQRLGSNSNAWLVYLAMFLGLLGASWLLHWGIEVRLRDFWYRAFSRLRGPADAAQEWIRLKVRN